MLLCLLRRTVLGWLPIEWKHPSKKKVVITKRTCENLVLASGTRKTWQKNSKWRTDKIVRDILRSFLSPRKAESPTYLLARVSVSLASCERKEGSTSVASDTIGSGHKVFEGRKGKVFASGPNKWPGEEALCEKTNHSSERREPPSLSGRTRRRFNPKWMLKSRCRECPISFLLLGNMQQWMRH